MVESEEVKTMLKEGLIKKIPKKLRTILFFIHSTSWEEETKKNLFVRIRSNRTKKYVDLQEKQKIYKKQ